MKCNLYYLTFLIKAQIFIIFILIYSFNHLAPCPSPHLKKHITGLPINEYAVSTKLAVAHWQVRW